MCGARNPPFPSAAEIKQRLPAGITGTCSHSRAVVVPFEARLQQQCWQRGQKHVSVPPAWWQLRPCGHLYNHSSLFLQQPQSKAVVSDHMNTHMRTIDLDFSDAQITILWMCLVSWVTLYQRNKPLKTFTLQPSWFFFKKIRNMKHITTCHFTVRVRTKCVNVCVCSACLQAHDSVSKD